MRTAGAIAIYYYLLTGLRIELTVGNNDERTEKVQIEQTLAPRCQVDKMQGHLDR